ncbi:MAG: hypothetical protein HYY06_07725 [Deltaproteobacteria bacterium]|nr:hypothetical protein [Deltaproteobacteria bacterium]
MRWLLVLIPLAGCVDLGGHAPDASPEPDGSLVDGGPVVDVVLSGLAFRPGTVEIPAGTTVRWTNLDAVAHTVTEGSPGGSAARVFDSPLLSTGQSFLWRFDEPGEWIYFCRTHPNVMRNNVVRVF